MAIGKEVDGIKVVISAEDRLTKSLKKAERGTEATAKKIDRSSKKISKSFDTTGKNVVRSMKIMAAGAALLLIPLSLHFKNAARDAEEMESKFEAVFRSSTDDVKSWADTLAQEVNRSRFSLMEFASTFQDTFVPLGFARGEAAELSKTLVELAVDVSSFNNKMETEVIRDFQSALVGNHETVRKYGIVVTEATLTQEILNTGLAKSKGEITELNKVQARLNIIMKNTSDAHGDAARTAESQANKEKELSAASEELSIVLGQRLEPATEALTQSMINATTALTDFFDVTEDAELNNLNEDLDDAIDQFNLLKETLENLSAFQKAMGAEAPLQRSLAISISQIDKLTVAIEKMTNARTDKKRADASKKEIAAIKDETDATIQAEETRHSTFAERMRKNLEVQIKADEFMAKNRDKRDAIELAAFEARVDAENKIIEENMRIAQMHADDFANSFQRAFDDLIFAGGKLSDVLKGLLADLARLVLHKALLGPLSDVLGGSLSKAFGFADGGPVGFASGGFVSGKGSSRSDSIPAMLSNGEFVVNAEATRKNVPVLNAINSGGTVSGGGQNVTIHQTLVFEAPVKDTVGAVVQAILPVVERQTQNIIAQSLRGIRT